MNHIDFSRNLIKGRIAETIFEEMFRLSEEFTVIPIGYEHTIPELAQYQHHIQVKQVLNNIRNAPDFALISQNKEKVFLVEVKYRHYINPDENYSLANQISTNWNPSFLFMASQEGFFFDSCYKILENNGLIKQLPYSWVQKDIQKKYFNLLKEFISNAM